VRHSPGIICLMSRFQYPKNVVPYKNNEEFLEDLDRVLREDYQIQLSLPELRQTGEAVTLFLRKCL